MPETFRVLFQFDIDRRSAAVLASQDITVRRIGRQTVLDRKSFTAIGRHPVEQARDGTAVGSADDVPGTGRGPLPGLAATLRAT